MIEEFVAIFPQVWAFLHDRITCSEWEVPTTLDDVLMWVKDETEIQRDNLVYDWEHKNAPLAIDTQEFIGLLEKAQVWLEQQGAVASVPPWEKYPETAFPVA